MPCFLVSVPEPLLTEVGIQEMWTNLSTVLVGNPVPRPGSDRGYGLHHPPRPPSRRWPWSKALATPRTGACPDPDVGPTVGGAIAPSV